MMAQDRYMIRPGRLRALGAAVTGRSFELAGDRVVPVWVYPARHARPLPGLAPRYTGPAGGRPADPESR